MVAPLLLATGEFAHAVGLTAPVQAAVSSLLFPQIETLKIWTSQNAFIKHPVIMPSIDAMLHAQAKGWFQWDEKDNQRTGGFQAFVEMMRRAGAAIGDKGYIEEMGIDYSKYNLAWRAVLDAGYARPGIKEAFAGRIADFLTEDEWATMVRRSGALPGDWKWMFPLLSERLTLDQYVDAWRRGLISEDQFRAITKQLQMFLPQDFALTKQLATFVPHPNELIRMVIRDAFNPELIKAFGLDQELDQNPDFLQWCRVQGLGPVTIKDDKGKEITRDFAKMEWYAHWQQPSPNMGYDFLHRFYSKSRYGPSPSLKDAPPFEQKDLDRLLRASDYSPPFRPWMTGVSFNPYTRIDVRRLRKSNIITKADVYHNYRASGYDDIHANNLTEYVEKDMQDTLFAKVKNGALRETLKSFTLGYFDETSAIAALVEVGFDKPEAEGNVIVARMGKVNRFTDQGIKAVRAGYFSGVFTRLELQTQLRSLDIVQSDIDEYIFLWVMQLNTRRKQVAATTVSAWFVDGLIDLAELVSRLTKLDYSPQDVTRIVQAAVLESAKRIRKAQQAAAGELQKQLEKSLQQAEKLRKEQIAREAARQKELDRLRKLSEAAANKRLHEFLASRTDKNLIAWYKKREISQNEIHDTLILRGFTEADAKRWIDAYTP